ncbi:MAG: NAD-dependent epimerase/dehydratase family protein [Candidatus Promineifilaceae bacterium]
MKALVTGAAGFIGSHLAERLLECGDEVIGLDNFNDYYDPDQKQANAQILKKHPAFTLIRADIRDRSQMLSLFEKEQFDAVAHLAAMAGVRNAVQHPNLYVDVDYVGTQNLMDGARNSSVKHFVMASTSSVYGSTEAIPFRETDPCAKPLQPYAAAKRAAEILGYAYSYLFDLNFTALRFFTVYGPRGRPDMMAFLVADSITSGRPIPLYEGGEMYRDWTYVSDIVDGFVAAIDRPMGYKIFNLGRGQPMKLSDFISIIEEYAGGRANVVVKPKPAADVTRTYADISEARRLLGYNPTVSVPSGVAAFWEWFSSRA